MDFKRVSRWVIIGLRCLNALVIWWNNRRYSSGEEKKEAKLLKEFEWQCKFKISELLNRGLILDDNCQPYMEDKKGDKIFHIFGKWKNGAAFKYRHSFSNYKKSHGK